MSDAKITRLAAEALELKKAWVMGIALIGKPASLPPDHLDLPNFLHWQIKPLKRHIDDLKRDVDVIGKSLILNGWSPSQRNAAVPWLATRYNEWMRSKQSIWEIGRVHEVENAIGKLGFRKHIECPAYAQVLIQGSFGASIRHPEYHLARDLALLNNLFLDAEAIADEHLRNKRPHSNENSQSLARSVILTCYNLLESFVSGLAAAFVIENPQAEEATLKKLREPDRKRSSLKARFEDVPSIITKQENAMMPFKSVLDHLFGDFKWRRDAFVHCEPGPAPTKFGTVKEIFFHETDAKIVKETTSLTIRAIRGAWKVIYKTDGPRWLPDPDTKGRFPSIEARLIESSSPS